MKHPVIKELCEVDTVVEVSEPPVPVPITGGSAVPAPAAGGIPVDAAEPKIKVLTEVAPPLSQDMYKTIGEMEKAKADVIDLYKDAFAIDQNVPPEVGSWVIGRYGGSEDWFIGTIQDLYYKEDNEDDDEEGATEVIAIDILYDLDDEPEKDVDGSLVQNYEKEVPLERVVYIQEKKKKQGKRKKKN